MDEYDVIVVGGGINGLTAGAYLAKAGLRVLITERRWETGGAVVTDEESGCWLNTHATYMMMMDVAPAYQDLNLSEYGCIYIRPQPAVSILARDGRALCLYNDVSKSAASISRFSRKDADLFVNVYDEFEAVVNQCLVPQTYRPSLPPMELVELLQEKEIGRKVIELSEKTPREIIEGCGFETDLLKTALLYLTTMWGIDPDVTGVGYLVPLYIVRMLNAALIRGGSHRLSSAIYKSLMSGTGEIEETTEVDKLLFEGPSVVGVKATNGKEYRARCVLSTVDPEQTFIRFIGGKQLDALAPGLADAVGGWEWEAVSHYVQHLIVHGEPAFDAARFDPEVGEALIQIMGVETVDELVSGFQSVRRGGLVKFGHSTTVTKFDASQGPLAIGRIMPEIQAPPAGLNVVRFETLAPYDPQGNGWDGLKHEYAKQCLDFLISYAPNLKNTRIIRNIVNPPTYIEMKFPNMKRGSIKHGEYSSMQMGYFRPNDRCSQYRTPIRGLYVGGASVYPGGMVLLGTGYCAASVIAEDLGISPWWAPPKHVQEAIEHGLAV